MHKLPADHQPVEAVSIKAWNMARPPRRVLVIRIQALGDLFACLPVLSALKTAHPEIELDLLCREDFAELPASLGLFREVHLLKGGTSGKKQLLRGLRMVPMLKRRQYDMVLDLQRNTQSRLIRKLLLPKAYSEFDRFSPHSPLLRYLWSVEKAGFSGLEPNYQFVTSFAHSPSAYEKLKNSGWDESQKLIILNPAGFSETRNWPLTNYAELMDRWLAMNPNTCFLLLGVEKMKEKSAQLKAAHPQAVIDLVGQTDLQEMFTYLLRSDLVISEDSGLGHIAWLSGQKTVIMLGSTRSDWTSPIGAHTVCFDSSHLPCGNCMQFKCPLGTNACMTDLKPEQVFESAWKLLTL